MSFSRSNIPNSHLLRKDAITSSVTLTGNRWDSSQARRGETAREVKDKELVRKWRNGSPYDGTADKETSRERTPIFHKIGNSTFAIYPKEAKAGTFATAGKQKQLKNYGYPEEKQGRVVQWGTQLSKKGNGDIL